MGHSKNNQLTSPILNLGGNEHERKIRETRPRTVDSQLLSHGRENLQESNVLPDNFVSLPKEKHDVIIHLIRAF